LLFLLLLFVHVFLDDGTVHFCQMFTIQIHALK
jgi:hypothetical protein